MKKRILSLLLILCMAVTLLPTAVFAEDATGKLIPAGGAKIGDTVYATLDEAMEAVSEGDTATIYLGEGIYSGNSVNPTEQGKGAGKNLTFVGAGTGETTWQIQAAKQYDSDGWCDYSFKGSDCITFENMTVVGSVYPDRSTKSNNTQGLTYINHITLKDCIFNGRADYWGYESTTFENVIFNAPGTEASGITDGDYSLWTYTGKEYTFKNCTFNSKFGKIVNVYRHSDTGYNIVVNFEDCTVISTAPNKSVLNIKDSNNNYTINISGINKVTGLNPNATTCSRWFQVESVGEGKNHYATVNIDGKPVWKDGKMVSHAIDTANDKYTDGYKDNAFTITYSEWTKNPDGTKTHTVTKTCNYCGYQESTTETAEADPIDWDVSKSKIATKLDTNTWTSNVTLSLPSAEEALGSDIVFVIDKSQCGAEASDAATELVGALLAQQELENAKLKVGIIAFGGTAKVIRPLSEVTSADDLNDSVAKTAAAGLHGSNIQSGLIEADKMLSADTEVSDSRKYVILVSDGHTYEFSKEGEYGEYVDGAAKFKGLKTYGIYSETDMYAYAYGISYTIHTLHDQYYTGDYNSDGTYKGQWRGNYLKDAPYILTDPVTGAEYVKNEYEMPYGTWDRYLEHITEVVNADNGMYDVELHYTTSGYIDYDNQYIKDDNDLKTNPKAETKRQKADRILGENNYIKCGLDENGKDNQLMHASGVDRAVYEAYSKYASMAEKYHCYPIYVKKDYYDSAQTTQDYGYQLMCALGKISNNTGLDVSTPNAPATVPAISNIFSSIKNGILYAVGAGSTVEDKMGDAFDFVPGSLKLTVGGTELESKADGNVTYFGDRAENLNEENFRFKVQYAPDTETFVWTINENVSNFAPVQLTYTVKLTNPETAPGTYGVEDLNGEKTLSEEEAEKALFTNAYAVLNAKNSAGAPVKAQEFPKPSVSYTVKSFIDASGSPAIIAAACLNTKDHYSYLIGYSDGTVRPNGRITRAEVATIFFRLLTDDARQRNWSSENNFSDVSADKWYNNAVSTLCHMGVLGGYSDGTFRPNAPITRAEFAKIAVSFSQANGSAVYSYFTDVKTTDWFAPYVTAAKDSGLIEGYSDGSFKPENRITRAEACAIVNRVLGRKPSKSHMKISGRIDWPDCTTADWFYEAIMEATNSHTYQMGKRVETWNDKLPQRDWVALEKIWSRANSR